MRYFSPTGELQFERDVLDELGKALAAPLIVSEKGVKTLVVVDGAKNETLDIFAGFKKNQNPQRRMVFFKIKQNKKDNNSVNEVSASNLAAGPFLLRNGKIGIIRAGTKPLLEVYDTNGAVVSSLELPDDGLFSSDSIDVTRDGFVTVVNHNNKIVGFYKMNMETSRFSAASDPAGGDVNTGLKFKEWVSRPLTTSAGDRVFTSKYGEIFHVNSEGKLGFSFHPMDYCYKKKIIPPQEFSGGRFAFACGKTIYILDNKGKELTHYDVPGAGEINAFKVLWNGSIVFSSEIDSTAVCPRSKVTFLNLFPFSCPVETEGGPSQSSRTRSGKEENAIGEASLPIERSSAVPARLNKDR
jgi:hypothetical protein